MATKVHPTTPPPSTSVRVPTAPRWGAEEDHQTYSPRKSARVSQRARVTQTPPASELPLSTNRTSPRYSKKPASTSMGSSPSRLSSPPTAAKKLVAGSPQVIGGRRVSGALSYDSTVSAATALGLPAPNNHTDNAAQLGAPPRTNGMLPTPAKTPKKRPSVGTPGISAIARNLFPLRGESADEAMPTPRKNGRKKYSGFTLDSFQGEEEDAGPIQIYTDSHDRVPEVDLSPDNPFFDMPDTRKSESGKRSSKRLKVMAPVESEEQTGEGAEKREGGMYYVFRGKRVFQEFPDEEETQDVEDVEPSLLHDDGVPETARRPLTRSSIKPRLLFPSVQKTNARATRSKGKELMRSEATEDEEEAVTDIEEQHDVTTPTDDVVNVVSTPKAPKYAPFSPPTTGRATRSKDINIGSSPAGPVSDDEAVSPMPRGRGGKLSHFDKWQRTKSGIGGSRKREAVSLPPGAGASKRTRG